MATDIYTMDSQKKEDAYTCPSFNNYSSDSLAEIAVRVVAEAPSHGQRIGSTEYDDFEFALVRDGSEILSEVFDGDGRIATVFPVFDRDLLLANAGAGGKIGSRSEGNLPESSIAVPLRELFSEEGENPASCSSSEADELEKIPASAYCLWRPRAADLPSPGRCKKSNSTGSAPKRWRFLDMLRSNSEGKERFFFLTPKNREERLTAVETPVKAKGNGVRPRARSAHEALYVKNRAAAEENKKRSYLPYRRYLVGYFANVNGLG